jgi:hypothetical protein
LFYFEELKKNQQQHNRTYSERPQSQKEAQPSEFSINGTTEKQHIPELVQIFSQENGLYSLV